MKSNVSNKNNKIQNPPFLLKFDPLKHSWVEEVVKCEIPVIFSCGDCNKFEKTFNKKFSEEKLIFKIVKTNFLNEKGKSKNPVPFFMFMLKSELIYQFSADSPEVNEYFEKVFVKIKEFSENNKGINYFSSSTTPNNHSSLNMSNSFINRKVSISIPVMLSPQNK